MPEPLHLLINELPEIHLDKFLKSFKQSVSRELKGPRKQFWQTRYYDRNIRGEAARLKSSTTSTRIPSNED